MLEKVRERTAMEEKRRKGYRNGLWAVVFLAVLAARVFFFYHNGVLASVGSMDEMREYIDRVCT